MSAEDTPRTLLRIEDRIAVVMTKAAASSAARPAGVCGGRC